MKCPVCNTQLEQVTVGSVQFDVCKSGCGGIFCDNFELQKIDMPNEDAGELLGEIENAKPFHRDAAHHLKCPKCQEVPMMTHFFSVKQQVQVDECPACGGIWLDCGELRRIRSEFHTEEDRRQAADAYFETLFGGQLAAMRRSSEENRDKAIRVGHMFRFICPSYYIPGGAHPLAGNNKKQ
jgi:Zn-finger nucleic acid-binding protein